MDCGFIAYLLGCNFVDVSLFNYGKKTTGNSLSRMYFGGGLPTNTITMTNKVHMHPHT